MTNRPLTTLFMLMSLDGKISTGDTDERDFDKDLKTIPGILEGLPQYYELEKQTDIVSFNTGRVMAKIGVNDRKETPAKIPCSFVIVDNYPHLTIAGVEYLSRWVKTLYLVTTNSDHPAKQVAADNIVVLESEQIDFPYLFEDLKSKFGIERVTIQSGGTVNAELIRAGLIDHLSIVVAPCLVGGKNTASLVDGESLKTEEDLRKIKPLHLESATVLNDGYLHLRYDVMNS
ncbi:MAG: dihydrofolate reductase family protein [bacterium]|nr:dihydrofolate reductase family protein [bacterium]